MRNEFDRSGSMVWSMLARKVWLVIISVMVTCWPICAWFEMDWMMGQALMIRARSSMAASQQDTSRSSPWICGS